MRFLVPKWRRTVAPAVADCHPPKIDYAFFVDGRRNLRWRDVISDNSMWALGIRTFMEYTERRFSTPEEMCNLLESTFHYLQETYLYAFACSPPLSLLLPHFHTWSRAPPWLALIATAQPRRMNNLNPHFGCATPECRSWEGLNKCQGVINHEYLIEFDPVITLGNSQPRTINFVSQMIREKKRKEEEFPAPRGV